MESGKKDQPVYFEYPTRTNDGGSVETVWNDASGASPPNNDWAFVISQRGDEAFVAARTESEEVIRLCVNYRDDVITEWRVKWDDQYYHIIRVDRSQRRTRGDLWITARLLEAQ